CVFKGGDNAKVAATAAQTPQEVAVFRFAGVDDPAVSRYHFGGNQVLGAHAILAAEPAKAATQGETGNTGGRDHAHGHGQAKGLGGGIQLTNGDAPTGPYAPADGIHFDLLQPGEVDDQAAVIGAMAGHVMTTTTHGKQQ